MFESSSVAVAASAAAGADAVRWLSANDATIGDLSFALDGIEAAERVIAWASAARHRYLARAQVHADAAAADPCDRDWISEDVAALLRVRSCDARTEMAYATQLVTRLPQVLAGLAAGAVSPRQAGYAAEATLPLDDDACLLFQERVMVRVADQTNAQFRRSVNRAVIAAAPRSAEQAHEAAANDRMVEARVADNGMGVLYAEMIAPDLMRVKTAL